MKKLGWISTAAFVALAAAIASPAARAAADVSFGVNAPLGDDGQLFFSISSRYFDRDQRVVDDWGRRFPNPDDLAVFLHICSHSRQSPEIVYRYRRQGFTWYEVGLRAGVPDEVWYVPIVQPPAPRYDRAYGQWKKHTHDPGCSVRLSDREARDLVAVRMAHEYYGVAPEVAMDWRRDGTSVRAIMTREYRARERHERRDDRYARPDDRHDDRDGDKHGDKHHGKRHDH